MKWAFIDYENVACLGKIELSVYQKVIIFLGAKQRKLDFKEKRYDKPIDLVLVQIKATQNNNLDFHLAYFLGKFDSEASKEVIFDVISNDSGFTHLVSYINGMGRACRQVLITTKNDPTTDLVDSTQKLIQTLKLNKKAKPKRIAALRNHIAATLKIRVDDGAIQSHINELECAGVLTVSDNGDIHYL